MGEVIIAYYHIGTGRISGSGVVPVREKKKTRSSFISGHWNPVTFCALAEMGTLHLAADRARDEGQTIPAR